MTNLEQFLAPHDPNTQITKLTNPTTKEVVYVVGDITNCNNNITYLGFSTLQNKSMPTQKSSFIIALVITKEEILKELTTTSCTTITCSNTKASGNNSTAMGYSTEASGNYSTAMGYYTEASGSYSTAMGSYTIASGESSTTMGYSTEALGNNSTAMGYYTEASGSYSTAMGSYTIASGESSTTMGSDTVASSLNSTAMGGNTKASGVYSTAMGYSTEALGNISTAIGYHTKTLGDYSIAIGNYSHAVGDYSTTMGSNIIANDPSMVAIGGAIWGDTYNYHTDYKTPFTPPAPITNMLQSIIDISLVNHTNKLGIDTSTSTSIFNTDLSGLITTSSSRNTNPPTEIKSVDLVQLVHYLIGAVQELDSKIKSLSSTTIT